MSTDRHHGRMAILLVGVLLLTGCAGSPILRKDGQTSLRPFRLANVAKADADMVSELTQREVLAGLRRLTEKLYRRNPQEFRKAGFDSAEPAVARIFDQIPVWGQSGLDRVDWMETLRLAFAEDYAGDRVHAYSLALTVMIMAAYEHRTEFFIADGLEAQKLYNSARNLETAVWKLSHARVAGGALFLLSNGLEDEARNLSFEREFGKLIAQQDLLALIVEDKDNRAINRVIHNVASFMLLPV